MKVCSCLLWISHYASAPFYCPFRVLIPLELPVPCFVLIVLFKINVSASLFIFASWDFNQKSAKCLKLFTLEQRVAELSVPPGFKSFWFYFNAEKMNLNIDAYLFTDAGWMLHSMQQETLRSDGAFLLCLRQWSSHNAVKEEKMKLDA